MATVKLHNCEPDQVGIPSTQDVAYTAIVENFSILQTVKNINLHLGHQPASPEITVSPENIRVPDLGPAGFHSVKFTVTLRDAPTGRNKFYWSTTYDTQPI